MKSFRSRRLLTALLVFMLLFSQVAPAFAVLEDDPKAFTATNPNDPTDPTVYWRDGWGNTLYPDITFTQVPKDPAPFGGKYDTLPTLGFIYQFDRLPDTIPDTSTGAYLNLSSQPEGSLMYHRFDLQGIFDKAPVGQWGYTPVPGQSVAIEGQWYLHLRFFNEFRSQLASTTHNYLMNVDVTPPQPVTGFTGGAIGTTTSRRRVFAWDNKQYDALAGVGGFRIYVNGQPKTFVPYLPWQEMPTSVTIEDLPEGASYVEIAAVDRATNESVRAGEWQYVDSVGAQVRVTAPERDGDMLQGSYTFSADATDSVGVKDVRFVIDGTPVGTDNTPPYELTYDTHALSDGPHQIQVFADDTVGRFAQATRFFSVSNLVVPPPPPPATIESTPSMLIDGKDAQNGPFFFTNHVRPLASFSSVNATTLPDTTGYFYSVDRSGSTIPTAGSDSVPKIGDPTSFSVDLPGYAQRFPSAMTSGETTAVEGEWDVHVRSYVANLSGLSAVTAHSRFGVDITPPSPVEELSVDATGWSNVYRHQLRWKDKVYEKFGAGNWVYPFTKGYDSLSGDKNWVMTVNGGAPMKWPRYAFSPYATVTIEDGLHTGDNVVAIQVEDNAGNLSAPAYSHILIDSAAPALSILHPAAGETVASRYTFDVQASDDASLTSIEFAIDGLTRQSGATQSMIFDTRTLADGMHHLDVTARDAAGHVTMRSRDFNVDNTSAPPGASESTPTIKIGGTDLTDTRVYWFTNALSPRVTLGVVNPAGQSNPAPTGYYYTVDRAASTLPTLGSDAVPYMGNETNVTLDMKTYGRRFPSPMATGESTITEGQWDVHVRSYNSAVMGLSAVTAHGRFGVDITAPTPVEQLSVDTTGWSDLDQHRITWKDKVYERFGAGFTTYPFNRGYDDLSGDKYWVVRVNDGTPISWQRYAYAPYPSLTLQDGLHPGDNVVTVQVEDEAGNLSAPSYAHILIDKAAPAVSIVKPGVGETVSSRYTFEAAASDDASLTSIAFAIDGVTRQTSAATTMSVDTRTLSNGVHRLAVTARDAAGHATTATRDFNVDNTVPPPAATESTPTVKMGDIDLSDGSVLLFTNVLFPQLQLGTIDPPNSNNPAPTGYYYTVDRADSTVPTLGSDSIPRTGADTPLTLDMRAYSSMFPSAMGSGESTASEGRWSVHVRSYNSNVDGLSAVTSHARFVLDVTPPSPVEQLSVDTTGWSTVYRHRIQWKDKVFEKFGSGTSSYPFNRGYDTLSGDEYWIVTVNSGAPVRWERSAFVPWPSYTVQDGLHPGDNVVSVQVQDGAGNVSAPAYTHILIDDGAPTFTIVSPTLGETVCGRYTFGVDARDDGGVSSITFAIDGVNRQSSTSQSMSFDTASLADGAHRLDVTVRDLSGKFSSQSRDFRVDNTSPPQATQESSPTVNMGTADIEDPRYIWFTNSLTPKMVFGSVNPAGAKDVPPVSEYWYVVDRRSNTVPTAANADRTPRVDPLTEQTLNMTDLARLHPSDGTGGASKPVEGDDWRIHVRSLNATGALSAVTAHGHFGIDITPPTPITGLSTDVNGWTEVYRHKISWRDMVYTKFGSGSWLYPFTKGYDALSGDHQWVLNVNGGDAIEWERFTGAPYAAATIENGLKPGKNTITVRVKDYAGNLSPAANVYIYVDSDTPSLSLSAPGTDQWLSETYTFKAAAKDAAGLSKVTFKIDGVVRQATTAQSMKFDTKRLRDGKHTLEVAARDMYGHTRSATRTFYVDNTHISVTGLSDWPDPFYPCLKDGYKDTSGIGWTTSERAPRTYVQIFNASGVKIREYAYADLASGRHGIAWDGRDASGKIALGTFYYRVATIDHANNWTITGKNATTIRNYEIVYLAPGKVKIVPR